MGMGMGPSRNVGDLVELDSDEMRTEVNNILSRPAASPHRGVFMQIPFCKSRCGYCPFYRYSLEEDVSRFTDATVTMLKRLGGKEYVLSQPFEIFYFGGGTPAAIGYRNLERILSTLAMYFQRMDGHEFTVENRVVDLNPDLLSLYKQYGVNRISMGVQTFDTDMRRKLGRFADREQVIDAILRVKEAGFRTSVDLMYSVPEQTVESFVEQVRMACEVEVDSMSQYRMKLPPFVPLKKRIDSGDSPPQPVRSEWTDMQLAGWDEAEKHGYHRWNTKNFGRTEDENCHYSFGRYYPTDLLPIGSGAGGHIGLMNFSSEHNLDTYYQQIENDSLPYPGGRINNMDSLYLSIFRKLLEQKGVDLAKLGRRFQIDSWQIHGEDIRNLREKKLANIDGDKVSLTKLGVIWWPEIAYSLSIDPGTVKISYEGLPMF
jgi:oxygen-independent coproporphyrinogen-3 oxidase